jgi:hypothetical protein
LPPLPQQIQARVITAEQPRGVDRWGFYQRMKEHERYGGTGYFITPEDIERRNYPKMTRLFEAIPSIRVIPAGSMIGGIPTSTTTGGASCTRI